MQDKICNEDNLTENGRLKIAWIRSGLSQEEFRAKIGISLSSLSTLIKGKSPVSWPVAYAVEIMHGFDADWIKEGKGISRADPSKRLDPWQRMILELFNRQLDSEFLERILTGMEWDERANDVLEYAEFAYLEGVMSPEEHAEFTANIRKQLNELQQERRIFFEQLNRGLPWEAEKDYGGESRMTRRMRGFWKEIQPDKDVDPEEGGGSILLQHIIRPLIMYFHFGENEWNRIKDQWIAHQRVVVEDRFYHLALEAIRELQAEIKELITASDDQRKFIKEIRPKHIRRGEAKFMSEDDIDQLLKTHNKGESDGTDG